MPQARTAYICADIAERGTGTASIRPSAQEARTWAAVGNAERAEEAIARSVAQREAISGDELDEFGGIMTFSLPRQLYYTADTWIWLPEFGEQAVRAAETAIDAYEAADPAERSFSDEAGAQADLALARVNNQDVESAVKVLWLVLDLPPDQCIGGIIASVMRVRSALQAPQYRGSTLVKNAQVEIEEYCRLPAKAMLPTSR